ncbi:MAG: ankyrin repeat domain-containing protein [Pseudomonadota bacterium]
MKHLLACGCLLLATLLPLSARAELPDAVRFSVTLEVGDVAQARAWLDQGLDPDFEGRLIGTGLMIGAWEGNIPLMELFLARGADIHRANRFGETALMLAAWKDRRAALRWLLAHGAQANRPAHEWTALHYAAFAGHGALVDDLLAAGADVNARSTNGSTVVMMAAREGHLAVARQLLAAGANPALKNDFGDDAVAWAMRQGNYDIARSFTSAADFAELARRAARDPGRPVRSLPAPDKAEEFMRMARLAEARGRRDEALSAWRKALAELKAQEAPQKVSAGGTARETRGGGKAPSALVIRAKRGEPARQTMRFTYAGDDEASLDALLEQARAAEAAGRRQEALRLFRQVSERIKVGR